LLDQDLFPALDVAVLDLGQLPEDLAAFGVGLDRRQLAIKISRVNLLGKKMADEAVGRGMAQGRTPGSIGRIFEA
jgi:hypothetical protein